MAGPPGPTSPISVGNVDPRSPSSTSGYHVFSQSGAASLGWRMGSYTDSYTTEQDSWIDNWNRDRLTQSLTLEISQIY